MSMLWAKWGIDIYVYELQQADHIYDWEGTAVLWLAMRMFVFLSEKRELTVVLKSGYFGIIYKNDSQFSL